MISAIFSGLLSLLSQFVTVSLTPIDLIITNLIPDLSSILVNIGNFFNLLKNYGAFVLSYTGLTHEIIAICVSLFLYNIYLPLAVHGIKLALRWYRMLMP